MKIQFKPCKFFLVFFVYFFIKVYKICELNDGENTMSEVVAADQLRQYVSRIERLESDKAEIADDMKQVFDEAKANGFDVKALRQVLKLKKLDKDSLAEQEAMLDLYRAALDI